MADINLNSIDTLRKNQIVNRLFDAENLTDLKSKFKNLSRTPITPTIVTTYFNDTAYVYNFTTIEEGFGNTIPNIKALCIGNSVTNIGNYAFADCIGLSGPLIIPDSVTYIGIAAFQNCGNLTGDLTIPNSVTYIGSGAFQNCTDFTGTLTIPNSVTYIESGAFAGCRDLTTVNCFVTRDIINAATDIFNGCTNLTIINVRANDNTWGAGPDNFYGKAVTIVKNLT